MTVRYVQNIHKHAPGEKRAYSLDWTDELAGQTIVSATWSIQPSGPVLTNDRIVENETKAVVAGGTIAIDYILRCVIQTSEGEIIDRSVLLECRYL